MLTRHARLARLKSRFDADTHGFTIALDGREMVRGALDSGAGPAAIEGFFKDYCAEELNGAPKVLTVAGHSFSDLNRKVVSIINLESLRALEAAVGTRVDPLRFRANFYINGWPAWHEFALMGRTMSVGRVAQIKLVKRIVRCAATNVDPRTGA